MFNDSLVCGSLPRTLTEALIIFVLKPGKDNTECSFYWPISHFNSDAKILAKVLALQIETMRWNHEKPWGAFCRPDWFHYFSNVCRLLNIIHSSASTEVSEVLVSLETEKAFDWVEWRYLFACLKKFGYGPNLILWIRLLYASPRATIIKNVKQSQYFQLSRGTRLGCPLLFTLAIEPLSIRLKSLTSVNGIYREAKEHRVSL